MAGGATFSCDACGKQYPWKAELAGKKAKCKCGAVVDIPAQPRAARAAARAPVAVAAAAAPVEQAGGYRCPACKNDLTPGTAICVNCGFDLRSGQYVSTQVDTGDDEAEAAPAPKKKKKAAAAAGGKVSATGWVGVTKSAREKAVAAEADKSRTMKQVIIALVLCVAVVGVIFGGKLIFKHMGNKGDQTANMKGDDAAANDLLQNHQPMEAAEFIKSHDSRMLGTQWTKGKALGKIKEWYDLGAVKVWVASDGLIAREVVIELPKEGEKRKALFDWITIWRDPTGEHPVKDEGQSYLMIAP